MERYRLIASIVALFIYLLAVYPWQTIIFAIIIFYGYLWYRFVKGEVFGDNLKSDQRRRALKEASIYLAPYQSIWGNLKLSNKQCSIRIGSHGGTIMASDNHDNRFRIIDPGIRSNDELWNMFCRVFSYNTTYKELMEQSERFGATIKVIGNSCVPEQQQNVNNANFNNYPPNTQKKELLDVNNASEVELTVLRI